MLSYYDGNAKVSDEQMRQHRPQEVSVDTERKTHFLLHFPFSNVGVYLYRQLHHLVRLALISTCIQLFLNKKMVTSDDT